MTTAHSTPQATYDIVIAGAGPAGLTIAIFAARRGRSVCLLEKAGQVGGALLINRGQLSGAGRSEEHTSELQSLMRIAEADVCLKKKNNTKTQHISRYK